MLKRINSSSILYNLRSKKFVGIRVCAITNISVRDDEIKLVKFIGRPLQFRKKFASLILRNKIKKERIRFSCSLTSPAVLNLKKLR